MESKSICKMVFLNEYIWILKQVQDDINNTCYDISDTQNNPTHGSTQTATPVSTVDDDQDNGEQGDGQSGCDLKTTTKK